MRRGAAREFLKRMRLLPIAILVAACATCGCARPDAVAASTASNAQLTHLYNEDQSDREGDVDWPRVLTRDGVRRAQVNTMLQEGTLHSAQDYLHAAMICQHGSRFEEARLAQALAIVAMTIDPHNEQARWLAAASLDRMLTYKHQPQWYGTQYSADAKGVYLYPTSDQAVTDDERRELHAPTLAEARAKVAEMAAMSHLPVRASPPTLEELQATRAD